MYALSISLGQKVRFTRDLGAMTDAYGGPKALTEVTVGTGDEGIYLGPSAIDEMRETGWHIIQVDREGTNAHGVASRPLFVPVHHSMIEPAEDQV